MKTAITLVTLLWSAAAWTATPDALDRFIGEWAMELEADAATFGDRGGAGTGTMICRWGLQRVWVDCELDSSYEGLGPYVMKTVLYRTRDEGVYGSFVTNSFGGGRLYQGTWTAPDEFVYRDAWVDPSRNWQHQRVTYRFADDGTVTFSIEVSGDGKEFLPHSRGKYRRVSSAAR